MAHAPVHVITVVLVFAHMLVSIQGNVKCFDAKDCSHENSTEDCKAYPAPSHIVKNCNKTCGLCDSEQMRCSFGYVERDGVCEPCETAVLADWDSKGECTQCPDVTKRGLHCDLDCLEECFHGCNTWTGHCHGCKGDSVTGLNRTGDFCEIKN